MGAEAQLYYVEVHLDTGSVVHLRDVQTFVLTKDDRGIEVVEVEWEFAPEAQQDVLRLRPQSVVAVVVEKQMAPSSSGLWQRVEVEQRDDYPPGKINKVKE